MKTSIVSSVRSGTALILILTLGLLPGEGWAGGTGHVEATFPPNQSLTLDQAVDYAFTHSPKVQVAEARLAEARGRVTSAKTYRYNPELDGNAGSRDGGGGSTFDFELGLAQEVEFTGQRRNRINAAQAAVEASTADLLRTKRLLAAQVHLTFISALEARALLEVTRQDMELARRLHDMAQRRRDRGAGTQLDVNVAAAELGRADASWQAARGGYLAARAALAEVIGADQTVLPVPLGDLTGPLAPPPSVEEAVRSGQQNRADLRALRKLEVEWRSRQALARSESWPNVTFRAYAGREAQTDTLIGGGVSIPIPLFNRNQGRIAVASANVDQAQATRELAALTVRREVITAHARYEAGRHTSQRLRELVLATLEENLSLLQRSFEGGKATWPEVIIIRRSFVGAQRELIAAEANARRAWIELQIASGRMPIPGPDDLREGE